ncbi:MAG TPA: 3-phosphoshikimate 1-carboxyvinyltransferase [Streptosporangiaceae bacterium]|jgi:3-phosphoshikimate 1-carboxyvinyltransferase|nr:3-phosphoshikimate 1-carboxyvinyltransferase [Streptosporangiaceae bacterium]
MQVTGQPDVDWQAPAAMTAVRASIRLPGSKSITNRALILAALADGPTTITGPLRARDTDLMAGAVTALGASIDDPGTVQAGKPTWTVTPGRASGAITVDVGNAGTVLRFVPPAAGLVTGDVQFSGDPRAAQRPVGELLAGLRQAGVEVDDGGRGAVPFVVRGGGRVRGGAITLDASSSSQLVSGLMLAAPRFEQGIQITHNGTRIPSAPHIAMTTAMLSAAGADVESWSSGNGTFPAPDSWRVRPGRLSPGTIVVEPDLSNAAPFLASALVTGGTITIPGWPAVSLQAASQILDVLQQMGATCQATNDGMRITGTGRIRGISADLRDISELAPVLTALAALADGPSEFTGIGHMRLHESDRLAVLAAEIGALGGQVAELPDGLRVVPRPLRAGPDPFDSHDDHRMVMAAAVLGLAVPGLRVRNASTVAKTFPAFLTLWQQMLEQAN